MWRDGDVARRRIGLVAPPWVPVPPPEYGGTELVIDQLARGLAAAGHEVVLFTTGDATCPVHRGWFHARALGTTADQLGELAHVQVAYDAFADMDIVHDHTLLGPLWAPRVGLRAPLVTTMHSEMVPTLHTLYEVIGRDAAVIAISHDQRRRADRVPIAAVIHHGIDVEHMPLGDGDGGYVVFLGRMSPAKGVHRAIAAARAAGRRIVIAAKMWEPTEHEYFRDVVEPILGPDATYIGQVGGHHKQELLAGAAALVNPIRWPEPFGLVMIEALAAGTPVVAFAEGAAPEIVDHGRTGFLSADTEQMATDLGLVDTIDRAACRRAAIERFSTARMVADHVALYERLLAGRTGGAGDRRSATDQSSSDTFAPPATGGGEVPTARTMRHASMA
ncbi:MAG: glycosyltransferase [Actinomycetota bacterium]|nr:glycosyltransferase [Actinomycetota bacterium]